MSQVERLFERYGPNYKWLVTLTVLLGLVALGMSITIVNVATPYIKGAFGMSSDQVQWLSTGFLAATTVALLVAPWLSRAFGQRATYMGLLMVFIGASILGGLATSMGGNHCRPRYSGRDDRPGSSGSTGGAFYRLSG
ncbi:MAG: MFS transporter [Marinobacter sp.]|nr:MFS transporter [Marinobacter sp.]